MDAPLAGGGRGYGEKHRLQLVGIRLLQAEGLPLAVLAVLIGAFGSLASPIVLVYAAELARGGRTGQAVGIAWGVGIAISSVAAPVTGAAIDAFGFAVAQTALGLLALLAAVGTLWLPRVRPGP